MDMHHLEDLQQSNLLGNYQSFTGGRQALPGARNLSFERHDRGQGRIAFYAVKDGAPVAYCVGYETKAEGKSAFQIASTFVNRPERRQGIGLALYHAILASGVMLLSDHELSEGGKSLWLALKRTAVVRNRKNHPSFIATNLKKAA